MYADLAFAGVGLFVGIDAWSCINPTGTWKRLIYKLEGNSDIDGDDYRNQSLFRTGNNSSPSCRIIQCDKRNFSVQTSSLGELYLST